MFIGSFMCFMLILVTGTLGNVTSTEVEDGKPLSEVVKVAKNL